MVTNYSWGHEDHIHQHQHHHHHHKKLTPGHQVGGCVSTIETKELRQRGKMDVEKETSGAARGDEIMYVMLINHNTRAPLPNMTD